MSFGKKETYKVVYTLPPAQQHGDNVGVALIEAASKQDAMYNFSKQYRGQYWTISSCNKLLG